VNRESKVLIGVGALALVGLFAAMSTSAMLGVLIIAAGLGGGMVYLRATRPDQTDPFADARSVADETNVGNITPAEPLAPWSPQGGLNAWTPPADLAPPPAPPAPVDPLADPAYGRLDEPTYGRLDEPRYGRLDEPPTHEPPVYEPTPEPATSWDDTSWDQSVTWEPTAPPPPPPAETNPLDDLVGLDRLDPVAEVQRIEEREATSPTPPEGITFGGRELDIHGNAVNEAVTGADDILAASQATELHLADGEQTELQKLLAKVQIRLSAYE
jgi:hypothetical protein